MAKYTEQIAEIVDFYAWEQPNATYQQKIDIAKKKIFDFDYPIFDENYRGVFEDHFIKHFFMYEIGQETFMQFKMRLEIWLLTNMPYFNKLFESELIEFDPMENTRVKTEYTKISDTDKDRTQGINETQGITGDITASGNANGTEGNVGTSSKNGTTDGTNQSRTTDQSFERKMEDETPQDRLGITANDGTGLINHASQIDEARKTASGTSDDTTHGAFENTGRSTSDTNTHSEFSNQGHSQTDSELKNDLTEKQLINNVEDYVQNRAGKIGVTNYADMLMKYRNTFLRIEVRIFNEMRELFMLIY